MAVLTKEQYENLTAETRKILENLSEGQTVRNVMAQIYVDNLADKTIKQGELMADGILQSVKNFDAGYQMAQKDMDGFLEEFQQKAEEGKNYAERCNYWLKLAAAITTAQNAMEDGADQDVLLQELEELTVPEDEATPERAAQLRMVAADAIKDSHLLLGALTEQSALLDEIGVRDAAGLLIDFGNQEVEFRAVVAMLTYTKIKNGTFKEMPVDITAEQVTSMVCAGIEEARILDAVGQGKLPVDVATVLLRILCVVLLAGLALTIALSGTAILVEIVSVLWNILGGLLCTFVVIGLCAEGIQVLKLVTTKVVTLVRKGATAIIDFVRGTIMPEAMQKARSIREKLASLCGESKEHRVEVTAE